MNEKFSIFHRPLCGILAPIMDGSRDSIRRRYAYKFGDHKWSFRLIYSINHLSNYCSPPLHSESLSVQRKSFCATFRRHSRFTPGRSRRSDTYTQTEPRALLITHSLTPIIDECFRGDRLVLHNLFERFHETEQFMLATC